MGRMVVTGAHGVYGAIHVVSGHDVGWWRAISDMLTGIKLYCVTEEAAEHDGVAVKWGLGNKMETAEDCARACLNHKITGENLPCNTFTWCQDEICYEPDAHKHTKGDCWLKFTEGPAYPEVCSGLESSCPVG